MTISQRDSSLFLPKIVLVLIGIFIPVTMSFHHHGDGEEYEICSICILAEKLSDFFLSDQPAVVASAIFYVHLIFYSSPYSNVLLLFYHSRAPPFSFPQYWAP